MQPSVGIGQFKGTEAEKVMLDRDEFKMPSAFQFCSDLACPCGLFSWQLVERAQKTKTKKHF